jgi:type I restriction enzyme S subunit
MSSPSYPKYKPSGVEWLSEVPESWEVRRIKHLGKTITGGTPKTEEPEYWTDGDVPWLPSGKVQNNSIHKEDADTFITKKALAESAAKLIRPGSALIALTGATCANAAFLTFESTANQSVVGIEPKLNADGRFIYYSLLSQREQVLTHKSGGAQGGINQEDVRNLVIAAPEKAEQTAIAKFLDRETGKIDGLVAEQQRLVKLLKEKRQAVISHAVTKGLNPHAPMKPSGIEWLGDVPVGWRIVQLSMLAKMIQTGPFGSQLHSEDYVENGIPVINPSNIQDGRIEPDWSCSITAEDANRLSQHKLINGDIVFGRRGEMGRCALVSANEVGWICGTGSLNVRLLPEVFPPFISIYLRTEYVREWLKLESVGSTMDNLNTQILGAIKLPLPNLSEQTAIVDYLETEIAKFDTLTAEAQRAIDLLQERRTALISAAVTGQIDVRQQPKN